jgi:hypothetical protein
VIENGGAFFLGGLVWLGMMSSVLAADDLAVKFSVVQEQLEIDFHPTALGPGITLFCALRAGNELGSAVIPFGENVEGSTVFLPFQADWLFLVQLGAESGRIIERRWEKWKWSDRRDVPDKAVWDSTRSVLRLPSRAQGPSMFALTRKIFARERRGAGWLHLRILARSRYGIHSALLRS